ncbi:MAG: hypothetical protein CL386_03065, partial [Acidiferrobacter sp.]|nr:hypothetical protein [Acidiferrobacter sp.]
MLRAVAIERNTAAIFMVALMIATPLLTYQTGIIDEKWGDEDELEKGEHPVTFVGSGATPDCNLTNVTISEVYAYSSDDWFELANSGGECDLGEWHIRDDDTSTGMILDNGTSIPANGTIYFSYDDGDFSFGIGNSDTLLVATRNVSSENATEVVTLEEYGRDGVGYSTDRDGSWELCDGEWDWNEPDEMTPNATNACEGDPFTLYVQESDGSWTEDPHSAPSGTASFLWNTSNLEVGNEYEIYSSWSTPIGVYQSLRFEFIADGSDITFETHADPDWTCELDFNSWIQDESTGTYIEYLYRDLEIDCPRKAEAKLYYVPGGSANNELMDDGYDLGAGDTTLQARLSGITATMAEQNYSITFYIKQDGHVTSFSEGECIRTGNNACWKEIDTYIHSHVCEIEVFAETQILSPHGWTESGSNLITADGPCDGTSGSIDEPISLYVQNGTDSSWSEIDSTNDDLDTSTSRDQSFYWDFPASVDGTDLRFYFYYEGDQVMDKRFQHDGEPIYWNATVSVDDCSPHV